MRYDAGKEAAVIDLTEQQRRELDRPGPTFVLVRRDIYEQVCRIVDGPNRNGWGDPADDLIQKPV